MIWVPVKDRLPLQGNKVLVCTASGSVQTAILSTPQTAGPLWKKDFFDDVVQGYINNVIAWAPLPKGYGEVTK